MPLLCHVLDGETEVHKVKEFPQVAHLGFPFTSLWPQGASSLPLCYIEFLAGQAGKTFWKGKKGTFYSSHIFIIIS